MILFMEFMKINSSVIIFLYKISLFTLIFELFGNLYQKYIELKIVECLINRNLLATNNFNLENDIGVAIYEW